MLQPEQYEAGTKIPVGKAGIPENGGVGIQNGGVGEEWNGVIAVIADNAGNDGGASVILARVEVGKIVESHNKS